MSRNAELDSKTLAVFLRKVAEQTAALSASEIRAIAEGRRTLRFTLTDANAGSSRKPDSKRELSETELESAMQSVRAVESREDAENVLNERFSSKAHLMQLARELDVHVAKTDDVQRIREKIVDNTVGFKLRSGAVRGIT